MKIVVLVENTAKSPELKPKHGLSLYIETEKHKLLFDMGKNEYFVENAGVLDVDLKDIDTAIISHGHDDHGGALELFLKENQRAKVYLSRRAFEGHYAKTDKGFRDIGLDRALLSSPRLALTGSSHIIDDELRLFSSVRDGGFRPSSNGSLYMDGENGPKPDDFAHEQSLIISSDNKLVLVGGCAHCGIKSIQLEAERICGREMDVVISGFHMYNPVLNMAEEDELVYKTIEFMEGNNTQYYTGHCTGERALRLMQARLGGRVEGIYTGMGIVI